MATKKRAVSEQNSNVQKFTGKQLLRTEKYSSVVARAVLKIDEVYSFDEADALIDNFMKKKG